MNLTPEQKSLIVRVVNVFETGRPEGDYGAVSILDDGPGGVAQVTYGRSQATEYGRLPELLRAYVASGGAQAGDLAGCLPRLTTGTLPGDAAFLALLGRAGGDPIMVRLQDELFEEKFFRPAMAWAAAEGFGLPLSGLVAYDSWVHSGGILPWLRKRFPERTPTHGGEERAWMRAYVEARRDWLASHARQVLRHTACRPRWFLARMAAGDWELRRRPLVVNGVKVAA